MKTEFLFEISNNYVKKLFWGVFSPKSLILEKNY